MLRRVFTQDADICAYDYALCIHVMHTCMHKWYYKSLYIYIDYGLHTGLWTNTLIIKANIVSCYWEILRHIISYHISNTSSTCCWFPPRRKKAVECHKPGRTKVFGTMPGCLDFTLSRKWCWKDSLMEKTLVWLDQSFSNWWFQPIWKILVKLDHFPK